MKWLVCVWLLSMGLIISRGYGHREYSPAYCDENANSSVEQNQCLLVVCHEFDPFDYSVLQCVRPEPCASGKTNITQDLRKPHPYCCPRAICINNENTTENN